MGTDVDLTQEPKNTLYRAFYVTALLLFTCSHGVLLLPFPRDSE